jgi:hypothetical protein
VRFVLFVEGYTEQETVGEFLKRWLDPQLARPVGIKIVRFNGWRQFIDDVADRVRMHLEAPARGQIIAALGLLDLYGPTFYPSHLTSAQERCAWAVTEIERKVSHAKFRMFFAVHELEAWILSQPQLLPEPVRRALPGRVNDPESIDFDEPPAKLLDRLYTSHTGRSYKKRTYGSELFRKLDPSVAYEKCPHLAEMLDHMLTMARHAVA